jgi:hypothetical protein
VGLFLFRRPPSAKTRHAARDERCEHHDGGEPHLRHAEIGRFQYDLNSVRNQAADLAA